MWRGGGGLKVLLLSFGSSWAFWKKFFWSSDECFNHTSTAKYSQRQQPNKKRLTTSQNLATKNTFWDKHHLEKLQIQKQSQLTHFINCILSFLKKIFYREDASNQHSINIKVNKRSASKISLWKVFYSFQWT